ncbi:MAG: cell division protein FtsX [Thermodesulfobacteriota bacterium]
MGGATNLRFFFSDAFRTIKENLATTLLTAVTLGFSLAIFTLFFFVFMNLNGMVTGWGGRTHVIAYVRDGAAAGNMDKLKAGVLRIEGVSGARFTSKGAAFKELKKGLKGHEGILEGIDKKILPASFEVTLDERYMGPDKIAGVVKRLKRLAWIEEVQYSQEWIQKLYGVLKFIELAALVVGIFLAAATVFIITNTIRLAVYARKEEIEILRLVGASDAFIKTPFFIEGVIQGIVGGTLALGMLFLARALLLYKMPGYLAFIADIPLPLAVLVPAVVFAGICMGVAGSLISISRFLKV